MKNKKPVVVIAIVILAVILYYSWIFIAGIISAGKITASGTIEAIEVQVGSKASGRVLTLAVDEGSTLKSGDLIAKIDVPEAEAALKNAKAAESAASSRYENLNTDFERTSALFEEGLVSNQQYDNAKTLRDGSKDAYIQAQAAVESAMVAIDNATITAPVDGTVLVRAVRAGELVSAGSTIVTLGDLKTLELKIYVGEKEVGKIDLGDKVMISVDSFPREIFYGTVKYISSKAEFTPKNIQTKEERVNQMFEVKVNIVNADLKLKPGMPADAVINVRN